MSELTATIQGRTFGMDTNPDLYWKAMSLNLQRRQIIWSIAEVRRKGGEPEQRLLDLFKTVDDFIDDGTY